MVLKKSKFGVNTGNTLRRCNTRYQQRRNRTAYLLAQSRWTADVTVLDDLGIIKNIIYSLSKKGRWELKDYLLQLTYYGKEYINLDPSVVVLVSEDHCKSSHSIGCYSTDVTTQRIGLGYINGSSNCVTNNRIGDTTHQIEFLYPSRADSAISYKPRRDSDVLSEHKGCSKRKRRKKVPLQDYLNEQNHMVTNIKKKEYMKKKSNPRKMVNHIKRKECIKMNLNPPILFPKNLRNIVSERDSSVWLYEDEEEDDIMEESSSYIQKVKHETSMFTEYFRNVIADVDAGKKPGIKQVIQRQRLVKERANRGGEHNSNKFKNKERFQLDTSNQIKSEVVQKISSVLVMIPKKEIDPLNLKQHYGQKYIECPCFPRKFVIDVSSRIEQKLKSSNWWKKEDDTRWNCTSCVTFSRDIFETNGTLNVDMYRVSLNMSTTHNQSYNLALNNNCNDGIEDILQGVVDSVNMSSARGLVKLEEELPKQRTIANFKMLNIYQNLDIESSNLSKEMTYSSMFTPSDLEINQDNELSYKIASFEFCGICYDCIMDSRKRVTVLNTCQHLFCDDCWLSYLRVRVNTGYVSIYCPGHNCFEIVPDSIILTFINLRQVNQLNYRRLQLTINSNKCSKCCTNVNCSCFITISNSEDATSIACQCGLQMCFRCQNDAHWPASCENVKLYWKKLMRMGEGNNAIKVSHLDLDTKQCPNCRINIEKIGIGILMSCICGTMFCWGCLGIYPDHTYTNVCIHSEDRFISRTTLNPIKTKHRKGNRSSSYYKLAFNHRLARDPLTINKLQDQVRDVIKKCKNLSKKRCSLYLLMLENFEFADDPRFPTCKQKMEDKIAGASWELMNAYISLHHIAEYSFVLLEELSQTGSQQFMLCTHIDQLSSAAEKIISIFKVSCDLDFRTLIDSLLRLEIQCRTVIKEYTSTIFGLKQLKL